MPRIRSTAEFHVHGLDCAEEILLIRKRLGKETGVGELSFDLLHGKLLVEYDHTQFSPTRIQQAVSETGLKCEPWRESDTNPSFWQRNGRIVLASISGGSLLAAMLWQGLTTGDLLRTMLAHQHAGGHHPAGPVLALCLLAIAAGSVFVAPKAMHSFRRFQPDMNALVVISIAGAMYLGEWIEGATLAFLFALAALLETYSITRARKAVEALMLVTPGEASVVHENHEHKVPVSKVAVGSIVRVRPGERIPCDGEVSAGDSDVNQAMITGESTPIWKTVGDPVFAGTMNGAGTLELRTNKPSSDSTLARIVRMVEGVQHRRAPSEQFVEKFSRYYTPAMLLLAAAVSVLPPLTMGGDWGDWFYHGMVILLISCPCALVISTPVSIVAALAAAARQGVLIKGGAYLEEAARLRAVAFDKTGVLTEGEPVVRSLHPLNDYSAEEILGRLAAIEFRSEHPLARALLRYAGERGIRPMEVSGFQSLQGKGAEGQVAGEKFWAGSLRLMSEKGLAIAGLDQRLQAFAAMEGSLVACGTDREAWALVTLADPVRAEARSAVAAIRAVGIEHVIMLTGDNAATARVVGDHVGVDEVRADLLPDDKEKAVREMIASYGKVAMVGDGINDAPAMACATVGIALGGAGIDVVMETADIVLMSGGLSKLGFLLRHARRTAAVIQQNVALALLMKAVFLALAFFGMATLWMAVAADMGATLLVTFNGLRLLRVKDS
ncbi:MAG: heavy metal translocating P-type ATPase [Acidobacteriia bacterium]|nr:heavy metal translocating P-type ATPase [Terriglobia bacterium]